MAGKAAAAGLRYGYIGLTFPEAKLAELPEAGEPPAGPSMAPVADGRLRIGWSAQPRYLCFGDSFRQEVRTEGSVLVNQDPPAEVTFQVAIGGISIAD